MATHNSKSDLPLATSIIISCQKIRVKIVHCTVARNLVTTVPASTSVALSNKTSVCLCNSSAMFRYVAAERRVHAVVRGAATEAVSKTLAAVRVLHTIHFLTELA